MTASGSVVVDRIDRAETRRRASPGARRAGRAVERGWEDPPAEEELDDRGAALQHQARHNSAAAAWWGASRAPGRVRGWRDVPPLPVAAFSDTRAGGGSGAPGGAEPTFLSSGTTSGPQPCSCRGPGALRSGARRRLPAPRVARSSRMRCSSWRLSRRAGARRYGMFGVLRERFGADGSVFDRGTGWTGSALIDALERAWWRPSRCSSWGRPSPSCTRSTRLTARTAASSCRRAAAGCSRREYPRAARVRWSRATAACCLRACAGSAPRPRPPRVRNGRAGEPVLRPRGRPSELPVGALALARPAHARAGGRRRRRSARGLGSGEPFDPLRAADRGPGRGRRRRIPAVGLASGCDSARLQPRGGRCSRG